MGIAPYFFFFVPFSTTKSTLQQESALKHVQLLCRYPTRPERSIPSVKYFWRTVYITRIGRIAIRQPASIQTICYLGLTTAILNSCWESRVLRFFSIRAMVWFLVKNVELT